MPKPILTNSLESRNKPVAILDSGVGGLPYLEFALCELPEESFVYIADTANYPYGEKKPAVIRQIVVNTAGRIITLLDPKCIVVACNTASVVALDLLREQYPVPFIGVVPAVKPAAAGSVKKKIGVLATLRTVENEYLNQLIESFAAACEVDILPAGKLRDLVENQFFILDRNEKIRIVREATREMPLDEIDTLVLACTHFLHLEEEFKIVLGNRVRIIDSREGVIKQLGRVLEKENMKATHKNRQDKFYLTAETSGSREHYQWFTARYRLEYAGEL